MLFLPTSRPEVGLDDSYEARCVACGYCAFGKIAADARFKVLSTAGPSRPAEGFAELSARSAAKHEVGFMRTTRLPQMAFYTAARRNIFGLL
jgi:hypothetical protein